jgi:WD40 repeat protein
MFILSVLACVIINTLQCVIAVQPDILYPFGPDSSDISLPKIDDASYGPIRLNFKLRFFNKVYSKLYVNTNGIISFLSPINKNLPLNNYIPISTPFISPFWSDINTLIGGRIYYRDSSSSSDLYKAKNDIVNVYSTTFNPSRVYIITWDQVAAFDGNSSVNNTFQLVIATDGKISFLVFNFGSISWPNSQFTINSFFGYNAGDNINYYSHPDSFTNNITNVASKSNVNLPGKWIFIVTSANLSSTTTTKTTSTTSITLVPGSLVYNLTGHTSYAYVLNTLTNGNLASGSLDGIIKIWNPNTGSLIYTLTGHTNGVTTLAALPNGNLASGSYDNTIKIWNPSTGSLVFTLTGHTNGLLTLAILSNGNLASGSYDNTVKIWNPITGSLIYTLTGHTNYVQKLGTLANGNLASGSGDNTVKIWNPSTGSLVYTLTGHTNGILALTSLSNGNLASGSYDNTIKIWNPSTGSLVYTLTEHRSAVWALAILPNGNLASGSYDRTIKIWNPNSGSLVYTLTGHTSPVYTLATFPNGNLASGSAYPDNTVKIWNSNTGSLVYTLTGHTSYVFTLATLPNGNLASGSADNTVKIWAT